MLNGLADLPCCFQPELSFLGRDKRNAGRIEALSHDPTDVLHGPVQVLPGVPCDLQSEAFDRDRGRKDDQIKMPMRSEALSRQHRHHVGRRQHGRYKLKRWHDKADASPVAHRGEVGIKRSAQVATAGNDDMRTRQPRIKAKVCDCRVDLAVLAETGEGLPR